MSERLNLLAVQVRVYSRYKDISNATEALLAALEDAEALLTSLQATREVLKECIDAPTNFRYRTAVKVARVVLASVFDGPDAA